MPPYLILSGTRVSLFPPSHEAKATMVWSSKSHSSFCPHFHSLCPAGLRFHCGIWERFPFVHKWHQASDCDIHENQKGSILLIMFWMTESYQKTGRRILLTECSQIQNRNNNMLLCFCVPLGLQERLQNICASQSCIDFMNIQEENNRTKLSYGDSLNPSQK